MAGSSIGAALLPSISKVPLAGEYGSSGLSARPIYCSVSEKKLDNFSFWNYANQNSPPKGAKGSLLP